MPRTKKRSYVQPVAEDLQGQYVSAIVEHRDNWPEIYKVMAHIEEVGVQADVDYCASTKRASLTDFYRRAGEKAGMHISQMRKIQRAGKFYVDNKDDSLPELDDPRVARTSPDTVNLIENIVRGEAERGGEHPEELARRLLLDLIERKGLTRKELKSWSDRVTGSRRRPRKEADPDISFSIQPSADDALGGARIHSFEIAALSAIDDRAWLSCMLKGDERLLGKFKAMTVGNAVKVDGESFFPACIVAETYTEPLAMHAIDFAHAHLTPTGRVRDDWAIPGFEYSWLVFADEPTKAAINRCKKNGVGVMHYADGKLSIALVAKRHDVDEAQRTAVHDGLLANTLGKAQYL